MKKKNIINLLLLSLVMAVLLVATASCDFLDKIMGKLDTGTVPKVKSAYLLRPDTDYLESKEYQFNKDSESAMPVLSGGKLLINIEYENPDNYAISYVKLNNEKIMPAKFAEGSNNTKTVLEITASETTGTLEESFVVNSVFYNSGSSTKRVQFSDDYDMTFEIIINPSYKLTLSYQNSDERVATKTAAQTSNKQTVVFGTKLSNYSVVDHDYSALVGVPVKAGGWVFEGYFTKPYGQGIAVNSEDSYYFWKDVTLYAHYSRMYKYQIVDLKEAIGQESIEYNYDSNGIQKTKDFKKGVIITEDTKKGHPVYDFGDTLVDEELVTDKNSGAITVKYNEYPIIGIGSNAFKDINTMTSLKIGKFVREIGYSAFDNCNQLAQVVFSEDCALTSIGDFAFQNTKAMGITSPFTIPDKVSYIGNFAFRYSGWSNTVNDGVAQSIIHIKSQYKFVGFRSFYKTGFQSVIFDAGCTFDSQINLENGKQLEKDGGWKTAQTDLNQIGAEIFANCAHLKNVIFNNITEGPEGNKVVTLPAVNIIPDRAFDAGNYTLDKIEVIKYSEGIKYIGKEAFNYQTLLSEILLPNSVEEIDKSAFYNCNNVYNLQIGDAGSQLKTLHMMAFANMSNIDRVVVNSSVFSKYGNGPFLGCSKLKSIEFPNINDVSQVPQGFSKAENDDEVLPQHKFSDFLYGTFETGELDQGGSDDVTLPQTYSVPTRIFCNKGTDSSVLAKFKENILAGKEMEGGGTSTGTRAWRDTIFVYDINLIFRGYDLGNGNTTDLALQEIYDYNSDSVVSYNLAFWSARSKDIKIPSAVYLEIDGVGKDRTITELGMYCLPTSVTSVTIPATITRIEHDAFNNCTQLQTINFEDIDKLEYIGENAFLGTKITSFTGGKNLQAIGQYAFWKCGNLKWVDLSQCTKITNVKEGRKSIKTQYKFDYEKTAIKKAKDTSSTKDSDALDYNNSLYYGAFQACKSLTWIYLPPNIARMSRSLFEGCINLAVVIIENANISTLTDYTDPDEGCFYENSQPRTVYDTLALAKGLMIYGQNLDSTHKVIFADCHYGSIENVPAKPN